MSWLRDLAFRLWWSRQAPTSPGYYFFHAFEVTQILEVAELNGRLAVARCGRPVVSEPSDYVGWWKGPIALPLSYRWLRTAAEVYPSGADRAAVSVHLSGGETALQLAPSCNRPPQPVPSQGDPGDQSDDFPLGADPSTGISGVEPAVRPDELSVFVAWAVDLADTADRVQRSLCPCEQDLQVLAKWFVVERTSANTAPFFHLKPTERLREILVALGATAKAAGKIGGAQ